MTKTTEVRNSRAIFRSLPERQKRIRKGGWRLPNSQRHTKEKATRMVHPGCRQKGGALSVEYLKTIRMTTLPTILNNDKILPLSSGHSHG